MKKILKITLIVVISLCLIIAGLIVTYEIWKYNREQNSKKLYFNFCNDLAIVPENMEGTYYRSFPADTFELERGMTKNEVEKIIRGYTRRKDYNDRLFVVAFDSLKTGFPVGFEEYNNGLYCDGSVQTFDDSTSHDPMFDKFSNDYPRPVPLPGMMNALEAVRNKDRSAVPALIEALQNKSNEAPWWAAYALGRLGDPSAVDPLIKSLEHKDWRVRWRSAEALGLLKDKKAVSPLMTGFEKEDDWYAKTGIVSALGNLGDKSSVPLLINALKDKDVGVQWRAAEALGKIGDKRAVLPLISMLDNKADKVQTASAHALGQIEDERIMPLLIKTMKSKKHTDSLKNKYIEIEREFWRELIDGVSMAIQLKHRREDLKELDNALNNENEGIRIAASLALLYIVEDKKSVDTVPFFIKALKDNNPIVQLNAIKAFRISKDKRSVLPLLEILDQVDPHVQIIIIYTLGEIGDERAVKPLEKILKNPEANEDFSLISTTEEALKKIMKK